MLFKAIKSAFEERKENKEAEKSASGSPTYNSASELIEGGIIKFGFNAIDFLSGKEALIKKVTTRELGKKSELGDDAHQIIFDCDLGSGELIKIRFTNDGKLWVSKKATREDVESIVDVEKFADVFDPDIAMAEVPVIGNTDSMSGLIGKEYHTHVYTQCYLHDRDLRKLQPYEYSEDGREQDYSFLMDSSEKFGIEIDVFDDALGNETDVYFCRRLKENKIEDFYPPA